VAEKAVDIARQPVKAKTLDTTLRTSLESVYKFLWAARQSDHKFKFPSSEQDLLADLATARRALDDVEDMVRGSQGGTKIRIADIRWGGEGGPTPGKKTFVGQKFFGRKRVRFSI
jgi:hypothetical protein